MNRGPVGQVLMRSAEIAVPLALAVKKLLMRSCRREFAGHLG